MMLREEFQKYDPKLILEKHVNALTPAKSILTKLAKKRKPALIY